MFILLLVQLLWNFLISCLIYILRICMWKYCRRQQLLYLIPSSPANIILFHHFVNFNESLLDDYFFDIFFLKTRLRFDCKFFIFLIYSGRLTNTNWDEFNIFKRFLKFFWRAFIKSKIFKIIQYLSEWMENSQKC